MNLIQYSNQVKELKLILNIVINNVYSDIHTKLQGIKTDSDRDILTNEERENFECLELINILQLNKTDPVVSRLLKQIKNNYL